MNLKITLTFAAIAVALTACETADTVTQPVAKRQPTTVDASKSVVGDAGMASFIAPKDCNRVSLDTMRAGGSTRIRSGCVIQSGDAMIVLGLNESPIPFKDAFSVSDGNTGNFQQAATAFPEETLGEFVVKREKSALASSEPGWRYSNRKSNLLRGNGGVEGASACVQYSFDGVSTAAPARKSKVTGLRCARFGTSADTVQEVMLDVMTFYPANQKVPARYSGITDQAHGSLAYR